MRSNYFLLLLLLLIGIPSSGCAKQDSNISGLDISVDIREESVDEIDFLFDDDFLDDDFDFENTYYDPLEPMNRFFFEFNDKLYYWILSPINTGYSAVVPWDIRYSIGNFVNNFAAPIRLLNNLLQWKINDAGIVLSRFVINSTLGVYGFGDPAWVEFGLEPKPEDFGQTLGIWGVGEGVYLCLPVIGPSNVRDMIGFGADAYTHPMVYFVDDIWVSGGYYTVSRVNLLSLNPTVYEDLKKYSLDPYVSIRQGYLDYRRTRINDKRSDRRSDNELSSDL